MPFAPAQSAAASSYAAERALIENLQARYLFALDFTDRDRYVTKATKPGRHHRVIRPGDDQADSAA